MFGWYEWGGLYWGNFVMLLIGSFFIYLGIVRKMEPFLLVPIGFGIIFVNIIGPLIGQVMVFGEDGLPVTGGISTEGLGVLNIIYSYGIKSEIVPLLIFLCIGTMTDFTPTIARPISFLFGAASQLGIFTIFLTAYLTGWYNINESASIGIIGGADGPTTIYVTNELAPGLLALTALVVYSYMALVPIIQPPIIKLLTTKKERAIYMKPQIRKVSKLETILFPVVVFIGAALLVPASAPLVGMFMFGNLLRVSGVTERLADSASGPFVDILTIILGITVGALMPAKQFLELETLGIIGLAIGAFAFSTAGGLLAAKFTNLFLKEKINPLIGAAGVSAVPMAARVAQIEGQKANPRNFLLMHAMGPNVAGCIATSVVAGVFLGMLS
jgi:carboxybiotin decarboxylase